MEYSFIAIPAVILLVLVLVFFLQSRVKSLPYEEHFVVQKGEAVYLSRRPGDGLMLYWDTLHQPARITLYADQEMMSVLDQWQPSADCDEMMIPLPEGILRPWVLFELLNGEKLFLTERFLPVQRVRNLRDIGGYLTNDGKQIAWGKVFRSGQLGHATPADLELLERLQIKHIIDLRDETEIEDVPDIFPSSVQYHHIYITDRVMVKRASVMIRRQRLGIEFNQSYKTMIVEQGAQGFGKVFRILSDPANLPVLFHCTAGKDRTGVAAALLYSLLGVPDEIILADYSLSNLFAAHYIREIERRIRKVRWMGMKVEHFYPIAAARPVVLKNTFDYIHETYGSVENYLTQKAGVDAQTIERLRANFLNE